MNLFSAVLVGLLVVSAQIGVGRAPNRRLPFSCATFPFGLSEINLRSRFGGSHVVIAPPWGGAEGDYNEGTVLFGDTADAKVEIFWRDRIGNREPEWISVRGTKGRWRTQGGIMLGTDVGAEYLPAIHS